MSGLAAGIRLAYFGLRVCIIEKHYAFGGLNSYYTLGGRQYDVGLHAVTNFVPPDDRQAPINKLFRQLRLTRDDFDLQPQRYSQIHIGDHRIRFGNGGSGLVDEVAREFPAEADRFAKLIAMLREANVDQLSRSHQSTRRVLQDYVACPALVDVLLCPAMYYGCAQEHDMDFAQFVTIFRSVVLEGLARPVEGVRTIIKTLVRKFRSCGGQLMMRTGVERINVEDGSVASLTLSNGDTVTADHVLSSAGLIETGRLRSDYCGAADEESVGRVSFVETIGILDEHPGKLGHEPAIVFFSDTEPFEYANPKEPIDVRSGVICCPSNYEGHDGMIEGVYRLTWLANSKFWTTCDDATYESTKQAYLEKFIERGERSIPGFAKRLICTDMFTPRTIRRFTGRINGAVYGCTAKRWSGSTDLKNLYICGTDQGFLGIIGSMLSGILMANEHVLAKG